MASPKTPTSKTPHHVMAIPTPKKPFHSLIAYTNEEVNKINGSWEYIAAAMGLTNTSEIGDLFYENLTAKTIFLDYCHGRDMNGGNWGLPHSGTNRITTSKYFLDLLGKDHFKMALASNTPPQPDEIDQTYRADYPNIITLWYGYRLIQAVPALFQRSQTLPHNQIDPYDALHAFYLLLTIHNKRRTALASGKPFDTQNSIRAKASPRDFPACGPSGVGSLASVSYDVQKVDPKIGLFHFGTFADQRRLLAAALDEGIDSFATEQQIRQFTHTSTKDPGLFAAVPPMGLGEVAHLSWNITSNPESELQKQCILLEWADMFTNHGSSDIRVTQAISIGDTMVGQFEEAREELESQNAKTKMFLDGEISAPIYGEEEWIKQQIQMKKNLVSARSLPIKEACQYAGIPLIGPDETPALQITGRYPSETPLKPWQPSAIAWMMAQESTKIHGGILADACGLGKTMSALCLIYFAARKLEAQGRLRTKRFRPTLIVVPASVILQWVNQIDTYFKDQLKVMIFWGSSEHTRDTGRKERTVNNWDELCGRLDDLDLDDPETAYTVIITSYQTWAARTTTSTRKARVAGQTDGTEDDHDDDDDRGDDQDAESENHTETLPPSGQFDCPANDGDMPLHATQSSAAAMELGIMQLHAEPNFEALTGCGATTATAALAALLMDKFKKKKKLPPTYISSCTYHFERVILDECQYVKSIRTCAHQSIAQIPRNALFGPTATPMWNRILDLYGYCSLLAGHLTVEFTAKDPTGGLLGPDGIRYPDLRSLYKAWSDITALPDDTSKIPYELLNPAVLVQLTKDTHGEVTTQIGYDAYSFLFRASIMQRSMGDRVLDQKGRLVIIGENIPPLRVMTIELRYNPQDQKYHNSNYDAFIESLHKSGGDDANNDSDSGGRINMGILRILCLAAFSPLLSKYLDSATHAQTLSQHIGRLLNGGDNGFEALFAATCRDISIPRLKDATDQAYYLCKRCPRLSMLLRIFDLEGAFDSPRPRFLLVCHWPMVAWMVEMFVVRLGLRSVSITASKTAEERAAAVAEFTSPQSGCQVMLTTYNCGATGLNLHESCHIVVLLESALNYNLEIQAIGRVHRIDQKEPQRAYRLFQDHTICRYLHNNNFQKMMPQVAAQYRDAFDAEVETATGTDPGSRSRHIHDACEKKLRELMGLHKGFPGYRTMDDKKDLNLSDKGVSKRNATPGRATKPPAPVAASTAVITVPAAVAPAVAPVTPTKRKTTEGEGRSAKRRTPAAEAPADSNKVAQITGQAPQANLPRPSSSLFSSKKAPKATAQETTTQEATTQVPTPRGPRLKLTMKGQQAKETPKDIPQEAPKVVPEYTVIPGEVPRARLASYIQSVPPSNKGDGGLGSSDEDDGGLGSSDEGDGGLGSSDEGDDGLGSSDDGDGGLDDGGLGPSDEESEESEWEPTPSRKPRA